MSQLHRPGVPAEGSPYEHGHRRLGILIVAKRLLKQGQHCRIVGNEIAETLDRRLAGHLVAAGPAVAVAQQRDLVEERGEGLGTADAREVADLRVKVEYGCTR